MESAQIYASGLVVRDLSMLPSSWRASGSLSEFLQRGRIVAIAGIDTRRLTRLLREGRAVRLHHDRRGRMRPPRCAPRARFRVSRAWTWRRLSARAHRINGTTAASGGAAPLRASSGCTWSPTTTESGATSAADRRPGLPHNGGAGHGTAAEVLALNPDGVFLSNGPGDPEPCDYAIKAIGELLETDMPVFGICLGHQLLGLASGAVRSR